MKIEVPKGLVGKEAFQYLVTNKREVVEMKKSATKFADPMWIDVQQSKTVHTADKAMRFLYENDEDKGVLKRTIVGNTYLWLDSHDDVHAKGVFAKSINERGTRIAHLHDHVFQLTAKVGTPISIKEMDISWRALGVGKTGMTQALIMESEIKQSFNPQIYEEYKNDQIDQHSVGMAYVKIELAVNDEDFGSEYKLWQEVVKELGNRPKAEAQGYFFYVTEAKLFELSAVIMGSNEVTPTLGNKSLPPAGTEKETVSTPLDVNKLLNNFKL